MDPLTVFFSELIGTFLLILLGDAAVANVNLNKSGMKGGGSVQVAFAWGLAVLLPCFIFGRSSGAHLNPALTIGLAVDGTISWNLVVYYICGQMLGAYLGATMVYCLFKEHFEATNEIPVQRACFCTAPAIKNNGRNFLSEFIGTFVLVFAIKGIGQVPGVQKSSADILVFTIIVSIGMSLGGLTGYAINPARDLGPRLAYATLPFKNKDPDWSYSWIPALGPITGSIFAVLLYQALLHLPGFALPLV